MAHGIDELGGKLLFNMKLVLELNKQFNFRFRIVKHKFHFYLNLELFFIYLFFINLRSYQIFTLN